MSTDRRVNCFRCRHYYVTWDPDFPRGCKAYEFKTHQMPSVVVFSSSGRPCLKFEPKESRKPDG
ncbi:MAG: uracil-DNA glycosylase [Thermobacillus sp. ZCTH02-B1]|uniref:uracil-DNA glycosylase n=1 Tax=Thermobacillus sp. ZCTH02-B1 TaxID=1858795 RepID=UPI000B57BADC|nr:uracil-DNA glycosylase [Thermobacillus sp. ZCTH02-B1]OUM97504.1 MAG: uracil-DNA glycosylase [Thermobacillus sp. ZCTH02-B1]